MPAPPRKRRRNVIEDDDNESEETEDSQQQQHQQQQRPPPPATSLPHSTRHGNQTSRSRTVEDNEAEDYADDTPQGPVDQDDDTAAEEPPDGDGSARSQMVKNLVRLALSSEYSRTPLRRAEITTKVLGARSRQFKTIFDEAQTVLRETFGMELVELPVRERITLRERRAVQSGASASATGAVSASASGGGGGSGASSASSTKSWILSNCLPAKFRTPDIVPPARCPTRDLEAAYVGLYSFIIAVITLNGGVLPDAKLDRYLKRVNAETSTPVEKTDKLLQRMIRDGYLVRAKENVGGDEVVEYLVGTRGKMEIGERGVEGLVRNVYGPANDEQAAELQKKIERSLRVSSARTLASQAATATVETRAAGRTEQATRQRGRPAAMRERARAAQDNNDDNDDGDDDDDRDDG